MNKLLLLEDDYLLNKTISNYLTSVGYIVFPVYDGNAAIEELSSQYDLLILDIDTPKRSGLEVLKESVDLFPDLPVLMISATIEINTIVKAYNIGCSDYIKKPFDVLELEMKIKHLLKHDNPIVEFENGLVYNLITESISLDNKEIELTQKERKLFSYLVKNRGLNISQESLSFYIWNEDIEKSNIRQLVSRVRKKLPDDMIVNSFGNGYCLK